MHYFSTKYSLEIISKYLRKNEENFDYRAEFLISTALEIVAKNIIIKFGDVYMKQLPGIAMGKPPAPPWATTYLHMKKYMIISIVTPEKSNFLKFIKRFIDAGCGLWEPTAKTSDKNRE